MDGMGFGKAQEEWGAAPKGSGQEGEAGDEARAKGLGSQSQSGVSFIPCVGQGGAGGGCHRGHSSWVIWLSLPMSRVLRQTKAYLASRSPP